MSEKILLVEDRPSRQQIYSKNSGIDLKRFNILKNVCGGEEFHSVKGENTKEINYFDKFDILMFHRSALSTDERTMIINYADSNSKTLVFFSGGISATNIQKVGKIQLLTINSKDFYSENLKLFLENEGKEISELAFGTNWKLNQLTSAKEKLTLNILNFVNEKVELEMILDELSFTQWIKDEYFNIDSSEIDKEQLVSINKNFEAKIKELVG